MHYIARLEHSEHGLDELRNPIWQHDVQFDGDPAKDELLNVVRDRALALVGSQHHRTRPKSSHEVYGPLCIDLTVRGDNKVVVETLKANYKASSENRDALKGCFENLVILFERGTSVRIQHFRRCWNQIADALTHQKFDFSVVFPGAFRQLEKMKNMPASMSQTFA